jgi:hypothetical protein
MRELAMNRAGRETFRHLPGPILIAGLGAALLIPSAEAAERQPRVAVIATPEGGIQPQAVLDDTGVVHLIYFKGEPSGGDLFYARSKPGTPEFSKPIRVNSQPGSAVAMGTIRGGQLALGRGGRVHIAWNGSQQAVPPNPIKGSPMLYSRLAEDRGSFEPQRNLMRRTFYLDGGGSLAADKEGNVYVAWHASSPDAPEGEAGRRLWVARSRDDGTTFTDEEPAIESSTGACGCCGTKAIVDRRGTLYILYRAAKANVERDMMLVTSGDHGAHFKATSLQPWPVTTCPMSSESLFDTPSGVLAAWETKGQIAFSLVNSESLVPSRPVSPPGGGNRKHPALAAGANGDTIVVWAEDTGWQRGGSLEWRIFNWSGRMTRERGRIEGGIPVWSLPAVVTLPDDRFLIIH